MIEIFGGIINQAANTRADFLNVPVPINEDWRIVEIRYAERHKDNIIAEMHFNRDRRHVIFSTSHSPPFTMDEKIIGGTYITVIIDNRSAGQAEGWFYFYAEREQVGAR